MIPAVSPPIHRLAQFGFNMLWTVLFTYPLMIGIQVVSARIGRVSGHGLATNIRRHYPAWLLYAVVSLVLVANTINIAADVSAMGEALRLIVGGPAQLYAVSFGLVSLLLQMFIPYRRYVRILKWLTLALLAYVAMAFVVHIPWPQVLAKTLAPRMSWKPEYITMMAARTDIMRQFVIGRRLKVLGWLATLMMAAAVGAMFLTMRV